ncbi:four helix bundle protein [Candidatus Omnitrophota bacterium]
MSQIINHKPNRYDLEQRTLNFTQKVIAYIEKLPKGLVNQEINRQLIRSAGSVGANYIEANESLGKKDFFMKVKTCKREAKEARYWLRLSRPFEEEKQRQSSLIQEATELMKIFGSIVEKASNNFRN